MNKPTISKIYVETNIGTDSVSVYLKMGGKRTHLFLKNDVIYQWRASPHISNPHWHKVNIKNKKPISILLANRQSSKLDGTLLEYLMTP